jgi:ribosomal protein S18 acetylase RimI-like enzyme
MIRLAIPDDTEPLIALAAGTGVFRPIELVALREVLDDYHREAHARGHRAVCYVEAGRPVGFAYHAPAAMTDRTWYLYWIAVDRERHGRGVGSALLRFAEDDARSRGARLFLIETSSLPHYEPTRWFYLGHGYERACAVPDYYADGDDLVVFSKRLAPAQGGSS